MELRRDRGRDGEQETGTCGLEVVGEQGSEQGAGGMKTFTVERQFGCLGATQSKQRHTCALFRDAMEDASTSELSQGHCQVLLRLAPEMRSMASPSRRSVLSRPPHRVVS